MVGKQHAVDLGLDFHLERGDVTAPAMVEAEVHEVADFLERHGERARRFGRRGLLSVRIPGGQDVAVEEQGDLEVARFVLDEKFAEPPEVGRRHDEVTDVEPRRGAVPFLEMNLDVAKKTHRRYAFRRGSLGPFSNARSAAMMPSSASMRCKRGRFVSSQRS